MLVDIVQVPVYIYKMSATAFFSVFLINITSVFYEQSPVKKQLAMLSCIVKALACISDGCISSGRGIVFFDNAGAP